MQARKMVGVTARYCCCRPRPDDDASLGPANQSRVEMDARPLMQLQIIASLTPPAKKWCLPTASCCRGRPDCDINPKPRIAHHAPRMELEGTPQSSEKLRSFLQKHNHCCCRRRRRRRGWGKTEQDSTLATRNFPIVTALTKLNHIG